jgi:hypothetical protein
LLRLIVLVAGVFAVLVLAPGKARADIGDTAGVLTGAVEDTVGTATDTVETAVPVVEETVGDAAGTVGDVVEDTTDTVGDASQTVTGVVDQVTDEVPIVSDTVDVVTDTVEVVTDAVDQPVGTVLGTVVDTVGGLPTETLPPLQPSGPAGTTTLPTEPVIDPATPADPGGIPTPPSGPAGEPTKPPVPGGPDGPYRPPVPTIPSPWPGEGTSIAAPSSEGGGPASSSNVPTLPDRVPVGASSAPPSGSPETAGHGLSQFAAFLAAAMALVIGMRRWLRPFADARAPNPFLSLVERPG